MINVFWKGAPGGRLIRLFSMLSLKSGLLLNRDVNLHAAGIVFLEKPELVQRFRKKCRKMILTGYQHGGGYHWESKNKTHMAEFKLCDNYIFWDLKPKNIHRWGLLDKLKFKIRNELSSKQGSAYLVMPVFSEFHDGLQSEIGFFNSFWWEIATKLPIGTIVIWHPRDTSLSTRLDSILLKLDKCYFIGTNPTLIWYCLKFGIEFAFFNDSCDSLKVDKRLKKFEITL